MRTLGILAVLLASICFPAVAARGQATRPDATLSPEVHADRKVTFRVRAPKASEVTLTGDWMATGAKEAMTKGDGGVWSITLGPLPAGPDIYNFTIDGVAVPDPVNPRVKLRARTSASVVEVPGDGSELWQPADVPHGLVEIVWQKSEVLHGETRAFRVYTPPGYASDASGAARYPVLYLLHGSNDTAAGWTDVGRANFILDNLIAQKRATPMIVVMPWGHAVPFDAPRETQGKNTLVFQEYLFRDVIPEVERRYRVAPGRESRALVGLSMGGGQAIEIGLGNLDRFGAVGAFSAAVPADFETRFKSLLDDPEGTNAKLAVLWIGCGRQDGLFPRSQKLSDVLMAHHVRHTFHPTDGVHNYAVWRQYLGEIAPLLFRTTGKGEPPVGK
jgi:enterochelin esterase-like enzyme